MHIRALAVSSLSLVLYAYPLAPAGASEAETKILREEIAQLRKDYEQRLAALEQRLLGAEAAASQRPGATDAGAANAGHRARQGMAPANAFNPEIGLTLQGALTRSQRDPATWTLQGFAPPGEPDEVGPPRRRGFTAQESELTVAANIDPNFRGQLNLALTPDNSVELEEAYVQTLGLGGGLTLKGGRFLSGIGYHNEFHPHAWDFADAPLVYSAFFGNPLTAEGVQLKWLAPTEQYLELGLEAGRDDAFPGGARNKSGAGLAAAFARLGGDIGVAQSWRAGLSYVSTQPQARGYDGLDAAGLATRVSFAGRSRTLGADFVWKWAPDGNPKERHVKLQGEYFRRLEDGVLSCSERDTSGACGGAGGIADRYRARQSGYYMQAVYQFLPRWRVGYRYDALDSGQPNFGPALVAADLPQLAAWKPQRNSLMLDFASSEFARLRFQLARENARGPGLADHQVWLQYVMSLGAHGAHKF